MKKRVIANLLIAKDGSTTFAGRSSGLSSPEDRRRFHILRSNADLILVGGNTARNEPYATTPCQLVVLTHGQLPRQIATNPQARAIATSVEEFLRGASGEILIEAGPSLLREALAKKLVDELFITVTERGGGENIVDLADLTKGYIESFREVVGNEIFLQFTPM